MTTEPESRAARHARRVTEMRTHWRDEARLRADGRSAEAERAKARGDQEFSSLIHDLTGALCQQAQQYLRDHSLVSDGVSEQVVSLYEQLRDLGDTPRARGWEAPLMFWTCFKRHASNVLVRVVQRANGKRWVTITDTVTGETAAGQAEQTETEIEAARGIRPSEQTADPDAERAFSRLLDADLLRALLQSIPDPKHRDALVLDCLGMPQAEIARRLNVSPKTVYNYIAKGRQAALLWARHHYAPHGTDAL